MGVFRSRAKGLGSRGARRGWRGPAVRAPGVSEQVMAGARADARLRAARRGPAVWDGGGLK
eukprot:2974518-Pyramimonas_sp.AAC.1